MKTHGVLGCAIDLLRSHLSERKKQGKTWNRNNLLMLNSTLGPLVWNIFNASKCKTAIEVENTIMINYEEKVVSVVKVACWDAIYDQ